MSRTKRNRQFLDPFAFGCGRGTPADDFLSTWRVFDVSDGSRPSILARRNVETVVGEDVSLHLRDNVPHRGRDLLIVGLEVPIPQRRGCGNPELTGRQLPPSRIDFIGEL